MRRAVITGGSRGIGAAIAARFVAEGWQTVDLSRSTGVDVTVPGVLSGRLTTEVSSMLGAVVCCAGEVDPKPIVDASAEELRRSLDVNLVHQWDTLRVLAASGWCGPVVLVGSTAGTKPSPGWASYSLAKAALHNLAVTAHAELAPKIRVYAVAPGRCATALRVRLAPEEDPGSIMQPDTVARVVVDLVLRDVPPVLAGQVIEVADRCHR